MTQSLRILIVEDNPGDAFLCKELLLEIGLSSKNIEEVSTLSECVESVQNNAFDVILLDLFLPDSQGKSTFDGVRSVSSSAAIIVLSGLTDYDVSMYAVQEGAQDFLVKGEFDASLLEKTIVYSIERLKQMTLLETTQRQYRDLFMKNPLPTLLLDFNTSIVVMTNQSASNYYGLKEDGLLGKKIDKLIELPLKEWVTIKERDTTVFQCKPFTANQAFSIARAYFRQIVLDDVPHWLVMIEDVTEQIRFEHEKTQLTNKVQDFERKKIAMELHDGIAQELTLLSLYLNQMGDSCSDKKVLDLCKRLVSDTINQTRTLTYSIDPPSLNEGLHNGLCAFFNRLSRIEHITFPFEIIGKYNLDFNYETSYNIFRIVQEFINNSVKHSKAKVIGCKVISKIDEVNFELHDEGIGFDMENSDKRGMGLKNIHERSQAMGFKIAFDSQINVGTKMYLTIDRSELVEL
jgi:two-component system, NarL family, sensor histidine kinase UhpB